MGRRRIVMTPDQDLRRSVVLTVVRASAILAFGLYTLVGLLLWFRGADSVPEALWFAAGGQTGVLGTLLANSKGGAEGGAGPAAGVTLTAPGGTMTVASEAGAVAADIAAPAPADLPDATLGPLATERLRRGS